MSENNKNVAVIGAGASGLIAARELLAEGHQVTVFEQREGVGGVWRYEQWDGPMDIRTCSSLPLSPMYQSLRTNIPAWMMGFRVYQQDFTEPGKPVRCFPAYQAVQDYLQRFSDDFQLNERIRFGCKVDQITPLESDRWKIKVSTEQKTETFFYDAVVICSGHFSKPHWPDIPGLKTFEGTLLHSIQYRSPEPFAGQRVLVIGLGSSGEDISLAVGDVAEQVYVAARTKGMNRSETAVGSRYGNNKNVIRIPLVTGCNGSQLLLESGDVLEDVDSIILCTGYEYDYPFLQLDRLGITCRANILAPLYLDLFCIEYPSLSILTVQRKVIPFPMAEFQARYVAQVLSGKATLPARDEMLKRSGGSNPELDPDALCYKEKQITYMSHLARLTGSPELPESYWPALDKVYDLRWKDPGGYRDTSVDAE
ncbi:FAD-dependent oxidoreductase [Spongorhabdus nitratireducens]